MNAIRHHWATDLLPAYWMIAPPAIGNRSMTNAHRPTLKGYAFVVRLPVPAKRGQDSALPTISDSE